jgi:hypothetical protein
MTVQAVIDALGRHSFRAASEAELQAALAEALLRAGFNVAREVRLSARDRIDLTADRVGIEVKVGGAVTDVIRQLDRYASHGALSALLLVTTRIMHVAPVERVAMLRGCPLRALHVGGLR